MKKVLISILSILVLLSSSLVFVSCKYTTPPPENLELSTVDESTIEEILHTLEDIKTELNSSTHTCNDYSTELDDIEEKLSNINTTEQSILSQLQTIQNTLNEIKKLCSTQKYEKVSLTTLNYFNYLTIHTEFDCNIIYVGNNSYTLCIDGTITTTKKIDCYFENVYISYTFDYDDAIYDSMSTIPRIQADYEGYSIVSFFATKENTVLSFAYNVPFLSSDISIENISGYVYVPIQES